MQQFIDIKTLAEVFVAWVTIVPLAYFCPIQGQGFYLFYYLR